MSTLAGGGGDLYGYLDGIGSLATFYGPYGVAVTSIGDVIVADSNNHKIRRVISSGRFFVPLHFSSFPFSIFYICACVLNCWWAGVVSTVAGGGIFLFGNVDGVGALAKFFYPRGLAVSFAGDLIVADTNNHLLRKIISSGICRCLTLCFFSFGKFQFCFAGLVSRIAGGLSMSLTRGLRNGFVDGFGSYARFSGPRGVAVSDVGEVFVADTTNNLIRIITFTGGNFMFCIVS